MLYGLSSYYKVFINFLSTFYQVYIKFLYTFGTSEEKIQLQSVNLIFWNFGVILWDFQICNSFCLNRP